MTRRRPSRSKRAPAKPASPAKSARPYLLPSPNAATNLVIADIVMRGASSLMRKGVERRIAQSSRNSDDAAQAELPGKTMVKTLALYGASKLATRSPLGLGVVVGALAVKTLYDIGKARETRNGTQQNAAKGTPDAVPEADTSE